MPCPSPETSPSGVTDRGAECPKCLVELEAAVRRSGCAAGSSQSPVWIADGSLICDVTDSGRIDDLLVGRVLPPLDGLGGRGVWLANQLCDLVQLRSGDGFTQVRLHTHLP